MRWWLTFVIALPLASCGTIPTAWSAEPVSPPLSAATVRGLISARGINPGTVFTIQERGRYALESVVIAQGRGTNEFIATVRIRPLSEVAR